MPSGSVKDIESTWPCVCWDLRLL